MLGQALSGLAYSPWGQAWRRRKRPILLFMGSVSLLLLGTCSTLPKDVSTAGKPPTLGVAWVVPTATVASPSAQQDPDDMLRVDDQGAVEVTAFPISLGPPTSDNVIFGIWMNTHSVDLSMDLATLSYLETDLGERVAAISWSGGSGHHVQGELVFPGTNSSGDAVLAGASAITLRIVDVDAPERLFHWELLPH